jgi:4-amino-4-deoxy-L-arabinose transferase-like glycosyltransferase
MRSRFDFLRRFDVLAPLALFVLFLAVSVPGISWGAPSLWNPDELVWRVKSALHGEMKFDITEPDFNYPSLPKQVMYVIGLVTYGLGQSDFAFIVSARLFSALLGALVAALVYVIARKVGASPRTAALAGLFYVLSGVVSANAHFAHNDLYLQFFTVLCLYFSLRYHYDGSRTWLLLAFLTVGMATSSKYTGASMVLLPSGLVLTKHWPTFRRTWLACLGTLLVGALLVIFGYGLGTPRLLTSPVDYLSHAIPAAVRFSKYGYYSSMPIGLIGQWAVFRDGVGWFLYLVFLLAFVWFAVRAALHFAGKSRMDPRVASGILILLLNVVLFDLPFLISINYVARHFIPFVPLLSILGAWFFEEVFEIAKSKQWTVARPALGASLIVGIVYSVLRLVSVSLLFLHDARIPASQYLEGIKGYKTSIEYTLYPPSIDRKRFDRAHNYPIYFFKYADDAVPTGGRYEYNQGEQGLLGRGTDYFVIDSFTYERFYVESVCASNPLECDFFKRLLAGDVASYRLVEEFRYRLPWYLPKVSIATVNPDILIYERARP